MAHPVTLDRWAELGRRRGSSIEWRMADGVRSRVTYLGDDFGLRRVACGLTRQDDVRPFAPT
jgi:hypothetical protein